MDNMNDASQIGYADAYGKPISDDVATWFERGVKEVETDEGRGLCSSTTTLYIFAAIIYFIVLSIALIVPISIATAISTQAK